MNSKKEADDVVGEIASISDTDLERLAEKVIPTLKREAKASDLEPRVVFFKQPETKHFILGSEVLYQLRTAGEHKRLDNWFFTTLGGTIGLLMPFFASAKAFYSRSPTSPVSLIDLVTIILFVVMLLGTVFIHQINKKKPNQKSVDDICNEVEALEKIYR